MAKDKKPSTSSKKSSSSSSKKKSSAIAAPVKPPSVHDDFSDDASSSSADSDSDDEPKASSSKGKAKVAQDAPRVSTKYEVPAGYATVKSQNEKSVVDWEEIKSNPNLELWAIRIPDGVKPKHLSGLTIKLPSKLTPENSTLPVGSLASKAGDFDIFVAAEPVKSGKRKRDDGERDEKPDVTIGVKGGEEMRALVPMLPKKSAGGKLFQAPRPLTHNLIMTRTVPTSVLSHLPSQSSSLIATQPSPVPGALLTADELLRPTDADVIAKKGSRVQPAGLKFRLALGGASGIKGGQGSYKHEPAVVRERFGDALPIIADDDAMEGVETQETEVKAEEDEAKKERKKSKKSRDGSESPKKKKVKA
ncbi:hypothetical protein MNV49_005904 [Pseudohyphozyma bogoriensis]|nr:hypothetical protein MNV49_005904 [Pseudohyphozyma bogoriensis]